MNELERLAADMKQADRRAQRWIFALVGGFLLSLLASFYLDGRIILSLLASNTIICVYGSVKASSRKDRVFVEYWRAAGLNDEQIAQKREQFFPTG
ncbi:hypothetical protein [Bosea sp. (in: a-proteobacteria)]|uniref:hypothetical protein n=1 Tax=Bosea sp. (in: a-proteobacteria) TaxID=1871050 RepID=UPI002B46409C|nr:hypothetical protein [Bosea sp. (in: a-proteobacteria)]WRH59006.1 MAG: hypothetical protein RSE11_04240 [Bosea sp. (in: a-proteobacteria)]